MFDTKPVYTTKAIKTKVIPELIKGMLDSIMEIKKKGVVDYLQVFDISVSANRTTYITHSQEVPEIKKQLMLTDTNNKFTGKIFIIDDGKCITVMMAEEY